MTDDEKSSLTHKQGSAAAAEDDSKNTPGADLDYLSPFLVNYAQGHALSKDEALLVKDAAIKSLKERLLERANIIQARLDGVTAEYQKRQAAFTRSDVAPAATAASGGGAQGPEATGTRKQDTAEEFARFSEDALFTIRVLEKRLAKVRLDAHFPPTFTTKPDIATSIPAATRELAKASRDIRDTIQASLVKPESTNEVKSTMCFETTCPKCSKPTWAGCGQHIESALKHVKPEDRCKCPREAAGPSCAGM
ncbi:hypothetical protein SeMB42_g04300 [Synchytrium endobioticum]|uniref:Dynein regulatory complex subunit 7 C-terminal domain-containing protein n=1 Tax=Synchytrium endobioticum TaxID=286115 RepID=A0A507CZE5_9FUNG|nr:hypothetical protein SeMB42_g04300 [Synchytrium endobioticum]